MFKRSVYILLITTLLSFTLQCSKSDKGTGPDDDEPTLLAVSPNHSMPLTVIDIDGMMIDSDSLSVYSAHVGGKLAPIRLIGDSLMQVGIPLFLDTAIGWSVTPTDSVSLEIWKRGELVAQSNKLIWIDSLPHASGAIEELQGTLDSLADNIRQFFVSLPTFYDWEAEYRDSIASVIENVVSGPDLSIAAILNGTSSLVDGESANKELVEALIASTGAVDYWEEYAASFASGSSRLKSRISSLQAASLLCPTLGEDAQIACQMQVYVLAKDFAEQFVSQTRQDWSSSVGWLFDAVSLFPPANVFPPVVVGKLISAVLTLSDIVINDAILSTLPSHITQFDMTLAADSMGTDEFTSTDIFITAANTPQKLTINEMIDLVFSLMALKTSTYNDDIVVVVGNVVQEIINQLRGIYLDMRSRDIEFFGNTDLTDPNWFVFPDIVWGPVLVNNHDLIELHSFDPEVLEVDTAVYEWWSVGCGEATIYASTRAAGERSRMVEPLWFCYGLCQYTGGAFGNDIAATTNRHITVGQPGGMDITISGLPVGDSADVWLYYPDNAFDYVGSSVSLTDMESGEYRIDANEVEGSDGITYASDPQSRTVDVTCDSTTTVNIEYLPKFGSIYLVVTGLDFEAAPQADIRVEGPNNYVRELIGTTLIDSLEPGIYDVFAFEVDDGWGQTYVPDPAVSELTVERANTATLVIDHQPKFGYINLQVRNLSTGTEADIDIVGPDGYFHHATNTEKIDSLLEGEYIVNAYDIVDNNGDTISPSPLSQVVAVTPDAQEVAWVDYSDGHDLTISFSGLPDGAPAMVSITGPEGYSASVTSDTTLTGLPDGGPFNISGENVQYNGVTYRPIPRDTSIYVYTDRTISLNYRGRSTISFLLGGLRSNWPSEQQQFLVRASSRATYPDTTITDLAFTPERGTLPEQLTIDSCFFEQGRMLLNGTYPYQADVSTAFGQATVELTLDVQDTTATITMDATVTLAPPSTPENMGSTDIMINLGSLFQILINNPNDPSVTSIAAMGVTGRFEVMNTDSSLHGIVSWDEYSNHCQDLGNGITVLTKRFDVADTLQVYGGSTGSGARSGQQNEVRTFFWLSLGGDARQGDATSEATVHGVLEFILRQN